MRPHQPLLYLWAFPTTCIGLFAAGLTAITGGKIKLHTGVIEASGGFATWFLTRGVPLPGGASAMTLGHVVIGRDQHSLNSTRAHERVHVRQVERWGPFFIPAYFIAALAVKLRGGDAYRDNPFEREAFDYCEE